MRAYWDAKARENAKYYIHSVLDYRRTDNDAFWASGAEALENTLGPFGRSIAAADRVLEIGCGIGRITKALAERAGHVIGVDVSAEMIERARLELAHLDNVELLAGNGRDLAQIPSSSCDVVYSFIVFQHIPDPAVTCNYVREIGRVLAGGGWTVFQVSDYPEIHRPEFHRAILGWRPRMERLFGRRPRGCMAPQWLGSAVARTDLLAALADGGLELDATVGDGTQFCLVHAHKPIDTSAPSST
ncbi:MAG: class I SAM-dependent methyltransferase [Acidimicrobiales bacterium]